MTVTRRSVRRAASTPAPVPGPDPRTAVDRAAQAYGPGPVTAAAGLTYEAARGEHPDFALTEEQAQVDWFVEHVGWAGFYCQVKAMLGSLCPWIPVKREGSEWVPAPDGRLAGVVDAIRPPLRSQAGLRYRSLFLQASIGEHAFWPADSSERGLVFDIAHPLQMARSPNSVDLFAVKTRRDASAGGPGWNEYPRERLRRHWVPDPKWPDEATASLARTLPELGLYRDTVASLRRTAQSRLLMNGLLFISTNENDEVGDPWTPEDVTSAEPGDASPSTPEDAGALERLLQEYARFGARAFRDHAGNDVASQLPFPFPHHTAPEHIDMGRTVAKEALEALTEIVFAAARGLNIPTQFLVSGEGSANSWNDAELRRALHERAVFPELEIHNGFWTDFAFRPLLIHARQGRFTPLLSIDDDPADYALGCDTSVLDLRSDSLQSIALALAQGIASRTWAAQKLGVPTSEMLDLPATVSDWEHWIYSKSAAGRSGAEVQRDFPEFGDDGLPALPAGDNEGGEPVRDVTPRAPEPDTATAAGRAIALIEANVR